MPSNKEYGKKEIYIHRFGRRLRRETPSFNKEEVEVHNRLMEESFNVGDADGVDIYEIGVQEHQEALGVCDI